jgi:Ribonuclease R winged-helix domain
LASPLTLTPQAYTLNQLRYDLRKMKGHGLLERVGRRYAYRLTEKGTRVAALFILFHTRICGPLAHSLFHHAPSSSSTQSKLRSPTTKPMLPFKIWLISWLPEKI